MLNIFKFNTTFPEKIMTGYPDFDFYLEKLNQCLWGPQSLRNRTLIEIRAHLLDKRQALLHDKTENKMLDLQVLQNMENVECISKTANKGILKKLSIQVLGIFVSYSIFILYLNGLPQSKTVLLIFLCTSIFLSVLMTYINIHQDSEALISLDDIDAKKYTVESTAHQILFMLIPLLIIILASFIASPSYRNIFIMLFILFTPIDIATVKIHVAADSILIERFGFKKNIPWLDIVGVKPLKDFTKLYTKLLLIDQDDLSRKVIYIDKHGKKKTFSVQSNLKNARRLIGDVIKHSKK